METALFEAYLLYNTDCVLIHHSLQYFSNFYKGIKIQDLRLSGVFKLESERKLAQRIKG